MKDQEISEEKLAQIKKAAAEGRIAFAPADRLMAKEELLHDFMEHVVGCKSYLLTDLSSIDEWEGSKHYPKWEERIQERYGVTIKLGQSGTHFICDVLDYIFEHASNDLAMCYK